MAGLNIPFSISRVVLTEWPFGSFLCQLIPFVQVTSVYVTSITMASIALDRYHVSFFKLVLNCEYFIDFSNKIRPGNNEPFRTSNENF